MAILWRDSMSVGNDLSDRDHRYLLCYINTIELALQTPEEKDILDGAMKQLYEYALGHFQREEMIQSKISYPGLQKHRIEHKELLKQLNEIKTSIEKNNDPKDLIERSSDTINFLRHWLLDHVLQKDKQLQPFLSDYPKSLY